MSVDILIVLVLSVVFIFIIEKYALNNPIVGHRLAIFCYTFYNPITNKILFIILAYWIVRLLVRQEVLYKNKHLMILFLVGTYLLLSGIIGISVSSTLDFSDVNSYLISPYFNGVIWAVVIASTLNTFNLIKSYVYSYVYFRLFEVGVTGLYFYFFQYDNLILLSELFKGTMRLDVDLTKRLISIASRNANEAAFLLLGIGGFIFINFYKKFNLFNSLLLLILISSLFLTWTRSGWILFIFLLILFFFVIGRVKSKFFYNSLVTSFFAIAFLIVMIINRNATESRVLSDETILMRFDLYYQYFTSIRLLPIFYGIFETIWTTCDKLLITKYISSENVFLDTFVKYGILGGCLFFTCSFMFLNNYLYILFKIKRVKDFILKEDYYFVVMLFSTFITVFVMLNISLFEQTSFFWILFGISIPLRQIVIKFNQRFIYENNV